MATFKCPEGFMMVPSENDPSTMVPFFVKTRSKDIINNMKDDFDGLVLETLENTYVDRDCDLEISYALGTIKFTSKNWYVTMYSSGEVSISRRIFLADKAFSYMNENTIKRANLSFPVKIKKESIQVHSILDTSDDETSATIISTVLGSTVDNAEFYDKMQLNLRAMLASASKETFKFVTLDSDDKITNEYPLSETTYKPAKFNTAKQEIYKNSSVFITITGRINE